MKAITNEITFLLIYPSFDRMEFQFTTCLLKATTSLFHCILFSYNGNPILIVEIF